MLSAALPPPSLASNTTSTSTADLEAEYFGGAASDQVIYIYNYIYNIYGNIYSQVTTEVSSRSGSIRVQYTGEEAVLSAMNGAQCDDVLLTADTDKPYVSQRMTVSADKYHSYLNLTAPSDECRRSSKGDLTFLAHNGHNSTLLLLLPCQPVPRDAVPAAAGVGPGAGGPGHRDQSAGGHSQEQSQVRRIK